MAYANVPPLSLSLQLWKASANAFAYSFVDNANAAYDPHAWFLLQLYVYAQVNGENCHLGTLTLTGLATYSAPKTTFEVPASSMTSLDALPSGSYSYALTGKPLTGDDLQTIASGSCSLAAPDDFTPAP